MRVIRIGLLALAGTALAGCVGLGAGSMQRDRIDYVTAVSESLKQQTLLNIVRLRYVEAPVFLDIAQIVGGYTMESSVSAFGSLFSTDGVVPGVPNSSVTLGATGRLTERPTITYTPLTGAQFSRNILTPIPPAAILFMIQAGWPADFVMSLTVETVNGLQNRSGVPARMNPGDPEFQRVTELMRTIQRSNAIGMKVTPRAPDSAVAVVFRLRAVPPEVVEAQRELRGLLGVPVDATEFKVSYGATTGGGAEIAMLTRSMATILIELATQIDVPAEHLAERRVSASLKDGGANIADLINIHSGRDRPDNAFVKVRYRDHWFWVDDRDLVSKRTFSFVLILFSLADTGGRETLPLITIPAG